MQRTLRIRHGRGIGSPIALFPVTRSASTLRVVALLCAMLGAERGSRPLAAEEPAAPPPAASVLPRGAEPDPLPLPHFPSRIHAFVWRNWGLVLEARLAATVGAEVEDLRALAVSMGLPASPRVNPDMERRGYLTLIRRNWHILPYDQILALLGWSAEKLAYTLREDDFLWIKLGLLKPRCEPLRLHQPTAEEAARARRIGDLVRSRFGDRVWRADEERFAFLAELSSPLAAERGDPSRGEAGSTPANEAGSPTGAAIAKDALSPRFLYSYFALYGDPLLEPDLDPFPDGYLARLGALGVDGIWLQGILRRLAPSRLFPDEGRDSAKRLRSLAELVARAGRHGIGVFLYFNEPRAQPLSWFEGRDGLRGVAEGDHAAVCTSAAETREFLREGMAHIFRTVPALRGFFTISASENLTSCWSHNGGAACPRCSKRPAAEVVAEVNRLLVEGAREGSPGAEAIIWDWGWADDWVAPIAASLPKGVRLQSVSEWSLPIERGGIRSVVGEYSISAVGPGPRAERHWRIARDAGLPFGAKVQINNTWEISAVPYVPTLDLVAEHLDRLRKTGATSLMLGWTLGGYPSPNLELASAFYGPEAPRPEDALARLARKRYDDGAPAALRAWKLFSDAYREYPVHISVLYRGPQQLGPANLLFAERTGYASTMVGFPYDDLDGWRGPYPSEVFIRQFETVARVWAKGIEELRAAIDAAPAALRAEARRDLNVAEACRIHFASVAAQARFVVAREALRGAAGDAGAREGAREGARGAALQAVRREVAREEALAVELLEVADSRIGYEASNHYYYLPRDLLEKVVSCRHLLEEAFRDEE